jgi:DNA repair exonuclease SbcCD ATPase subunit
VLKKVTVQNVKGIEFAEFAPGVLTVLSGSNGTGKTSILDAIRAVFAGGNDPGLIRMDQEMAIVELELEDGTTIRKRIKQNGGDLVVKNPEGKVVKAPAAYVEGLASSFAFDPLAFLTAPPKHRAAWLAAVMPIAVKPEQILARVAHPKNRPAIAEMLPEGPMDLEGLNNARKAIYEARTGENAVVKRLSGTVDSLQASLGADEEMDWSTKHAELLADLTNKRRERDALSEGTMAEYERRKAEIVAKGRADIDLAVKDLLAQIEKLKRLIETTTDAINADVNAQAAKAFEELSAKEREDAAALNVAIESLTEEVATAKEKADQQARNEQTRRMLDQTRTEYLAAIAKAGLLDQAIEAMDKAKAKALSETPIPGLELAGEKIIYEGIEFDQLNTQQQYELAIEIGAQRAGSLPLMVSDCAEHLDPQKFEAFKSAAVQSGFQIVMARVGEGSLHAEIMDGEGAVHSEALTVQ